MIRVADYIVDFLYKKGVRHIFMLSGGGAMHLNDAVAAHKKIDYVCHHHEQAAAMAAEAYAKTNGNFGAAMVTTGPGTTNAITGLMGAWQDSIPCMFISGQAKRNETVHNANLPFRQFGVQEFDIIPVVTPMTKFAVMVNDPGKIRFFMEKAYYLAKKGRPGPVWIDVPLDVQGALVDPDTLISFKPSESDKNNTSSPSIKQLEQAINLLKQAKKPLIIAGGGIRLAGAVDDFLRLVKTLKIPVVSTTMAIDLLEFDHPYYVGHGGTKGQRAGNIALQNTDLIIALGTRLAVPFIGYDYDQFAPQAKKVVIDIDENEHKKKTIKIDLFIKSDVKIFIKKLFSQIKEIQFNFKKNWLEKCVNLKYLYPSCSKEYAQEKKPINMYNAVDIISNHLRSTDIITSDAGTTFYVVSQTLKVKRGQRTVFPGCTLTMGYNLPGAIGMSFATDKKRRIICITGDGSFQMNIHELQTIVHYKLPVKIFILNNQGYLAIRTTQKNFFKHLIGESNKSGVSFPDTQKIADAYGIKFFRASTSSELLKNIKAALDYPGPVIYDIICPFFQPIITVSSKKLSDGKMISAPLDDLWPFLPEEEMNKIRKDLC